MANPKVANLPKAYNFAQPVPPPPVYEIFKTSTFEDTVVSDKKDVAEKAVVAENKPKWLVRGDLSDATAVEDMLNLR